MKKLLALAATATVAAALAVPAFASTTSVRVGDDWFVRNTSGTPVVTISRGATVKFVWVGKERHNAVQTSGPAGTKYHTPTMRKGTFSHRYTKKGTYQYFCTLHSFMKLTIRVR